MPAAGLLESDLFGAPGAARLPGASAQPDGRFELADKARCFWMKWATCRWSWPKLLRVLQEQSFRASRRQ